MEIELTTKTIPATISRKRAMEICARSISMIDKAVEANYIDFGHSGRNVLIVVNKKWRDFVRLCFIRDVLKKRSFTSKRTTIAGVLAEAKESGLFDPEDLKRLKKEKLIYQ